MLGVDWGMDLVTPSLSQIFQSPVVPQLPEAAYGSSPQHGAEHSCCRASSVRNIPSHRFEQCDDVQVTRMRQQIMLTFRAAVLAPLLLLLALLLGDT